jgi:putative acetyltransferase
MVSAADVQIRTAGHADAAAIAKCLAEAFASYRSEYTPAAFAETVPLESGVRLRLEQMHVLVATAAGEVVGTVSASSDSGCGHLRGVAVLPEWHGRGVAARLLAAIEDWLRSSGCTEATLETTMPLATAIRFYEKHGYRRSGNIFDYFGMPLIEYSKPL